jgi:hypothetical protein
MSSSREDGGKAPYCPEAASPIDIRFYVDNADYLAMNYLEVTVKQDHYRKRVVKVQEEEESSRAEGYLTTIVPEGNITLVTCALVTCPSEETELRCGEVRFPARIPVDRIHEVTYSTVEACQKDETPSLYVRQLSGN